MLAKIYSAAVNGVDAYEVQVAVNADRASSLMAAIGLAPTIDKSRKRVVVAIQNSGYRCPSGRATLALTPSEAPREGPGLDLPIALAMTAMGEGIPLTDFNQCCFVGGLAADGTVRPVDGILPIALEAKRRGRQAVIVPEANASEAAAVEGIAAFGVRNLRQAFDFLRGRHRIPPVEAHYRQQGLPNYGLDFSDVRGHHAVKRALEVAVAGGHPLIMVGASGSGRAMLAKRIPTIMPPMTFEEALEVTCIHSIHGFLSSQRPFLNQRPFRSPQYSSPDSEILGGGRGGKFAPGEATLAHHGVLFLDELPEFRPSTLDALGRALATGKLTLRRSRREFPANFAFVGALAPCPCGFFGDLKRECRCSAVDVRRYRQRISRSLLECVDVQVEVSAVPFKELTATHSAESSEAIRERVMAARAVQKERFSAMSTIRCNARMSPEWVEKYCRLDEESEKLLGAASLDVGQGPGVRNSILKMARTIADLSGDAKIAPQHLREALQYRALDRMKLEVG